MQFGFNFCVSIIIVMLLLNQGKINNGWKSVPRLWNAISFFIRRTVKQTVNNMNLYRNSKTNSKHPIPWKVNSDNLIL